MATADGAACQGLQRGLQSAAGVLARPAAPARTAWCLAQEHMPGMATPNEGSVTTPEIVNGRR